MNILLNSAGFIARNIEDIILYGENQDSSLVRAVTQLSSRFLSVTVFPIALTFELLFKRIPKTLFTPIRIQKNPVQEGHPSKFQRRCDKIAKFALGILFSPLGVFSPDCVSGLFLKNPNSADSIRPFGVENLYGKTGLSILRPKTAQEAEQMVKEAIQNKKKISIVGAGMSEGTQTIPQEVDSVIVDTRFLNTVEIDVENNCAHVGAGATWEIVQMAANQSGKSVIVKQASDPFSVGGSIGMNCHGWAHDRGAIASTIKSLTIVDAEGNVKKISPKDEMFGCFFGTLGYFGLIIEAEIELTNNENLIELTDTIQPEQFKAVYQNTIKDRGIPLFGGRLSLDMRRENPLTEIEMVQYVRDEEANLGQKIVKTDQ